LEFRISYKKSVIRDLKHIPKIRLKKLISALEKKLKNNPHAGKALKGKFKGLLRIRIGDYRIIYAIIQKEVLILRIADRKQSYR
jgi:mRNA interferase RelE/StbE